VGAGGGIAFEQAGLIEIGREAFGFAHIVKVAQRIGLAQMGVIGLGAVILIGEVANIEGTEDGDAKQDIERLAAQGQTAPVWQRGHGGLLG
jgi:hypothetical protein